MSLNSIDRKKEILKLLDSKGKVNTKELVKRLEVSSETITTKESERLVRLPMYYHLTLEDKEYIVDTIFKYFHQSR